MYTASSTADSTCNKEKKKDPPEHSYLKQLQLSKKPVYENGISRDAHKKKNNFQRNPTIPCIKKDQIFMKKRSSLSLSISKRLLLFFPLSLEKANKNVTFFILLLLDQVQWIKRKRKKQ